MKLDFWTFIQIHLFGKEVLFEWLGSKDCIRDCRYYKVLIRTPKDPWSKKN